MNTITRIAGIILAAGESRRMGKLKQCLPYKGKSLLECVIDNALASSLHRVIVVLGCEADRLATLIKDKNVGIVINNRYTEGQSSSLKSGLQAITADVDAVLFLLGDQPLVMPETINMLLAAFEKAPSSPVVLPAFKGKRGNPVLFSRETFSRIKMLKEDCGARSLIQEYGKRIVYVEVPDSSIHFDIDTEDDYRLLLRSECGSDSILKT